MLSPALLLLQSALFTLLVLFMQPVVARQLHGQAHEQVQLQVHGRYNSALQKDSYRNSKLKKTVFITTKITLDSQKRSAISKTQPAVPARMMDSAGNSAAQRSLKTQSPDISNPASTATDSLAALNMIKEQNRLLNYLKDLGVTDQKTKTNKKFYYHMANVFARLKLYPLAMKCFFKAARINDRRLDSAYLSRERNDQQSDLMPEKLKYASLEVNTRDDTIVKKAALLLKSQTGRKRRERIKKSIATSFPRILGNFNDGKRAVAYAMLFHVKQPAPGKRKIFVGVNTGHTFITLIKYNADSTYVSTSFGFYPDKDQLLSATPFAPTTSATFKDDTGHLWDEVLGKFISKRNFENILQLTQKFEGMTYNLNKQNCTDFGLQAAAIVGIYIKDTYGKWPMGRGNNPALTGQSILKGKVTNVAPETGEELFVNQLVEAGPL
jgi:hypothetical protein